MKSRVRNNSAAIVSAMLARNLSAKAAAELSGIGKATFSQLIQKDSHISYSTASKLQAIFGSDTIAITPLEKACRAFEDATSK